MCRVGTGDYPKGNRNLFLKPVFIDKPGDVQTLTFCFHLLPLPFVTTSSASS